MSALPDLEAMDRAALLALWANTLGGEPPARLSQPFLRRVLAWELQAREQGGLPTAVRKKLETFAAAQARGKEKSSTPKLKPGGRLLREWAGVTHVVDVVEGGFLWRGERHRSLSAIAQAITGAHWSGPRFFGLKEGSEGAKGTGRTKRPTPPAPVKTSHPNSASVRRRAKARPATTAPRPVVDEEAA